jgi:hypothetical protein
MPLYWKLIIHPLITGVLTILWLTVLHSLYDSNFGNQLSLSQFVAPVIHHTMRIFNDCLFSGKPKQVLKI